jgi:hypothetical protein
MMVVESGSRCGGGKQADVEMGEKGKVRLTPFWRWIWEED